MTCLLEQLLSVKDCSQQSQDRGDVGQAVANAKEDVSRILWILWTFPKCHVVSCRFWARQHSSENTTCWSIDQTSGSKSMILPWRTFPPSIRNPSQNAEKVFPLQSEFLMEFINTEVLLFQQAFQASPGIYQTHLHRFEEDWPRRQKINKSSFQLHGGWEMWLKQVSSFLLSRN